MNELNRKAAAMLRLADSEYSLDEAGLGALQSRFAAMVREAPESEEGPRVLAVGAPRRVDLDSGGPIPLLLASSYSGQRRWEVEYSHNAWIVASDLRTGVVLAARPFVPGKREQTPKPSMTGPAPDEINSRTVLSGVQMVDMRPLFGGDWSPSRIAVTAIVYDWVSNTVVVDLRGKGQPAQRGPREPSAFLSSSTETVAGGFGLLLPSRIGLNGDLPIRGSVSGAGPVLAATILLIKRDEPQPVRIDLAVPATSRNGAAAASFAFNAREALGDVAIEGTYQAYLVAGDGVAGPYPITVGSEH